MAFADHPNSPDFMLKPVTPSKLWPTFNGNPLARIDGWAFNLQGEITGLNIMPGVNYELIFLKPRLALLIDKLKPTKGIALLEVTRKRNIKWVLI